MKPSSDEFPATGDIGDGDRNIAAFRSDIIVPKRLELIGEGEECEEDDAALVEEAKDQVALSPGTDTHLTS